MQFLKIKYHYLENQLLRVKKENKLIYQCFKLERLVVVVINH